MKSFISLVCSLAIFQALAAAASIPRYFQTSPITRRQLNTTQVQWELGPQLSNASAIFGPDDSRYKEATTRWNTFAVPKVQVVVEPSKESDIPTIVKYCNENSLEFLAINRGHGDTQSLGSFNGVQINMAKFGNISIQPGGKSAWFGGGVYDGQAVRYLWDKGYVTTTGACNCVGMMGPGLGGGHGPLEGLHGMISDNFLQLNVVLANGTAIRVNENTHSDLLWGMKGAGHNFGIVTSFEMNIFPRGPDTWHYSNYVWRGDKLDDIFNALNTLHGNGTTPVNMLINFGSFLMNTTITKDEPVISWTFAYRGTAAEADKYLAPFNKIESVSSESGDVPYPQISVAQGNSEDSPVCQDNHVRITATAGLQVYNITAEQQIFDGFKHRAATDPELASGADILHEGYSTKAVDAQNPDDSSYPFRSDHHLMLIQTVIPPGNSKIEQDAWAWAREVRDQWNEGQPGRPIDAYVNYANGFEPVEQMYGHEAWRLDKLRGLKAEYDPSNRFRYYNPIIRENGASVH